MESTSVLATNSLLWLLSTENGYVEVAIWVLERGKSWTEPYQVKSVVVQWYSLSLAFTPLSFWKKFRFFGIHRAATRFMPKQSFKMVWINSWGTESSAAISFELKWRFLVTISLILALLPVCQSNQETDRDPDG